MGFKVERKGTLICDDCGKEVVTTSHSNKYDFFRVVIEELSQDGSGSATDFFGIRKEEKYYCSACMRKRFKNK